RRKKDRASTRPARRPFEASARARTTYRRVDGAEAPRGESDCATSAARPPAEGPPEAATATPATQRVRAPAPAAEAATATPATQWARAPALAADPATAAPATPWARAPALAAGPATAAPATPWARAPALAAGPATAAPATQ